MPDILTGLIHHWKLDEAPGVTTGIVDSAGTATGAFTGGGGITFTTSGKINNAFDNPGGNSSINVGILADVAGLSQFTESYWYKKGTVGAYLAVGQEDNAAGYPNALAIEISSGGEAYFSVSDNSANNQHGQITTEPNDTSWHLATMVFDGTQTGNANRLKAYIDGVQQTLSFTGTIQATTTATAHNWYLGDVNPSEGTYFFGSLDDVRIYNRALSSADVAALYAWNGTGTGTALPAGLSAASAVSSLVGDPYGLPAGQVAVSAENNPVGVPVGLPAGQTAVSAETNLVGDPYALPAGETAASAENNALGVPFALPVGQAAASVENGPLGLGIGLVSGNSAASAENNGLGCPAGLPAGDSIVSAENDPLGVATARPAGESLTATEHDPPGEDICFPSGQAVASAENDPLGAPIGISTGIAVVSSENHASGAPTAVASGLSLVAVENDPTANGYGTQDGIAVPTGLSLVAAENDPTATTGVIQPAGGSLGARRQRTGRRGGSFSYLPEFWPLDNSISSVAYPVGVAARSAQGHPSALGSAVARPVGVAARAAHGYPFALGSAEARSAIVPTLLGKVGQITSKGIINPTDDELTLILLAA